VGWHQVGGAYLGQAADRGCQVTCGEGPERICVYLGIFSKGATQRAPRKRAEQLPKMVPPPELSWGDSQVGIIPNQIGATRRMDQADSVRGYPLFVRQLATEMKVA
jgi:hypothetical protein